MYEDNDKIGSLVLKTAPTLEPITTAEAKAHMRITTSDDDTYIATLIIAARRIVENIINRALVTQTWNYYLPCFPYENYIEIPFGNLSSITSLTYIDSANTSAVWAASNYLVDTSGTPGKIVLAYNLSWPSVVLKPVNAINIEFVAGYGATAASVPETIRHALLLLIEHLYDNRGLVSDEGLKEIPFTVDVLLTPYRIFSFV